MADEDESAAGLGLRHATERRQARERRAIARPTWERRQRERRRTHAQKLLLSGIMLTVPFGSTTTARQATTAAHRVDPVRAPGGLTPAASDTPTAQAFDDIAPQTVASPMDTLEAIIIEAAQTHDIPAKLILEVIRAESGFNMSAVSRTGALGLMQLMPETAARYGATDPFDPRQNVFAGVQYLKELLDLHRGNVALALASYNAGPTAVARARGIPPFQETRAYVRKILKRCGRIHLRRLR